MKLPTTTRRIEVAILTLVGVCVLGLVGEDLVGLRGRWAVRSAESLLLSLHGQSRDLAEERGAPVRFVADPVTQTVTIEEGCTGRGKVLATRDFNLSYRVDMRTGGDALELCMTPEGGAAGERRGTVTFLRDGHVSSVTLPKVGEIR